MIFVCVSGFLRPPASGRRGGRQLPAVAPLALASPAPLWGSEPEERGRRVEVGRQAGVCACFLSSHPGPFGRLGAFVDLLGPAEGEAGSGPRVRSSCAGLPSSRLPISRLPSVRPSPFPDAGLGVRGGEAGPRRGRVIAVLPPPPPPGQSPVRVGGPRAARSAALPPSFSEGRSVGLTPPLVAGSCFCTFVCGGSVPRGGCPLRDGSRGQRVRGLGSGESQGVGKVANLMWGEHVWVAAALLVASNSLFSLDPPL